ncbi:hypothetical protein ACQPZX_37760 [Actinoplanes sp. CA-142083]|uniref:hypothetical protein n=1 Tax=Actinoplanes sp. CA-142083 TaxID=3239903 RepID=UPI003D8F2A77
MTLGSCTNIQSYVVTSATTVTVKTPALGCTASSGSGDNVSIIVGSDDITTANAITFVTPPAIDVVGNKPVTADNSLVLASGQKVQKFTTNGGQYVRVVADAAYAFDPRSAAGLAVTFGGKAGTDIKVYADADDTTALANSVAGTAGNSFTFKTASGLTAAADPTLTITQNGVSSSFQTAATGASIVNAPTITSMSVTSGKAKASTTTVITGTHFDTTAANYGSTTNVTFCGVAATSYGNPAVNAAGTQITVVTPDVTNVTPGLGVGYYAGSCGVVVDDGTNKSPVTPASVFTFLKE